MTSSDQPWWISAPVADLAAAILPLFGQSSFDSERAAMTDVVSWLRTGARAPRGTFSAGVSTRGDVFQNPDLRAVADSTNITAGCCKKLTHDEIYEILLECK